MIYEVTVKPNSKKGPLVVVEPLVASVAQNSSDVSNSSNSSDSLNFLDAPRQLTVYLREKPVDGEANAALIKLLAKHFHVAKSCIHIKTGVRGRRKLVEVIAS